MICEEETALALSPVGTEGGVVSVGGGALLATVTVTGSEVY